MPRRRSTSYSCRTARRACAAKVGAAFGVVALSQLDRVRWIAAGGRRGAETFVGRGRQADLLDTVEAEASGRTDLLAAVRAGQPRASRGGVAFIVSDFFDPRGATRAHSDLLSRRYRVRAIEIEDNEALAPPPLGRARLVDSETGAVMKLSITSEVLEAYRHARETRNHGLQSFCRWAGVGFLRVRADQPFFEIVRTAIARGWLAP